MSRKITGLFSKIKLLWKGCGLEKYLPLAATYIILPLIIIIMQRSNQSEWKSDAVIAVIKIFLPIISAWWSFLLLSMIKELNELSGLLERTIAAEVLICTFAYFIVMTPFCLEILNIYADEWVSIYFPDIFAQCFLSNCIVYCIAETIGTPVSGYLAAVILNLFIDGRISYILRMMGIENFSLSALISFVTGIILLIIGMAGSRFKN
ncbi:MAG: hypothetical protein VZR00_03130 [Lachnospiraceae bacterium]|nr:hypothetical protein [Lachnospiraceae bacterium]MEE3460870.1 hypothetical protein [Lachnospiraceae bacterium]